MVQWCTVVHCLFIVWLCCTQATTRIWNECHTIQWVISPKHWCRTRRRKEEEVPTILSRIQWPERMARDPGPSTKRCTRPSKWMKWYWTCQAMHRRWTVCWIFTSSTSTRVQQINNTIPVIQRRERESSVLHGTTYYSGTMVHMWHLYRTLRTQNSVRNR